MKNFSHVGISNIIPGEKKDDKSRTVNFDIERGTYEISVDGIIFEDNNPANNKVSVIVEVV